MMWYELGYMSEMDFYGERMKRRREEARVTPKQVADAIGIRVDYIYRYENATMEPELPTYIAIENYIRGIVLDRMIKNGGLPPKSNFTTEDLTPLRIDDFYGEALRYQRMEAELTLREVEEFTGVNYRQVSRYENGNDIPTIRSYIQIENLYRIEARRVHARNRIENR